VFDSIRVGLELSPVAGALSRAQPQSRGAPGPLARAAQLVIECSAAGSPPGFNLRRERRGKMRRRQELRRAKSGSIAFALTLCTSAAVADNGSGAPKRPPVGVTFCSPGYIESKNACSGDKSTSDAPAACRAECHRKFCS
jgi:hypothetical protein